MKLPEPYRIADKTIRLLNRKAVRRTDQAKQRLIADGFDELNVMRRVDDLFSTLDRDNRSAFKDLYVSRYIEMAHFLRKREEREDIVDELAELFITELLGEPDDVTLYAYDAEVLRKRDRAKEAMNAVPTKAQKQLELEKALRYWSRMTQQYVDSVSDGAALQAMDDADIEFVRWHTQEDLKVCVECDRLDEKVFRISDVPVKPHWRCRCWLEPLDSSEYALENSENDGIIIPEELFRKNDNITREQFKSISDERFDQLTIAARKKGAIILRGTEDVEKHLDEMNATASTMGNVLLFRKNVCVSEVLEETRHFEQNLSKMNDDKPTVLRTILNEMEAREYIFKNASRYQVPRNEIEFLKIQYEQLKEQLIEYQRNQ